MKSLLLSVLFSSITFAQTDIRDVVKKYAATLYNLEQGMTDISDVLSSEIDYDSNGNMTVKDVKKLEKTILLKVDGDKYYTYYESTSLATGDIYREVELDYIEMDNEDFSGIKNFYVKDDVLFADIFIEIQFGTDTIITEGPMQKNLLEPILCGSNSKIKNKWTMDGGLVINTKHFEDSKCDRKRTTNELKALIPILKEIDFCDYTTADAECEYEKDMSYLLNNL
jgi:hypothetical protein